MEIENTIKFAQPKEHKARIILWADLSVNDIDNLNDAATAEDIRSELARMFNLTDWRDNSKSAILLDLYLYSIQFARDNKFNREQTSVFFSIVKKVHEVCTETPFGNLDQCFRYFRELVLCHAVKRPPFSIDLYSAEQVRNITDYVLNTYFRHFKMYKYVFTPQVSLDLTLEYEGMPPEPELVADQETQPGEQAEDGTQEIAPADDAAVTQDAEEDAAAMSELRTLVRKHLEQEVKKLKVTVNEQIRESEEVLSQKLAHAEGSPTGKPKAKGKAK